MEGRAATCKRRERLRVSEGRQERCSVDAAQVAGLHPLRLMHETTATALAYGIYKTLPTHFPCFDSSIHRQGKKHEAAALEQEKKDLRFRNEVQKRTALEASRATDTLQKPTGKREATRKRARLVLTTPEESKVTDKATNVSETKHKNGHAPIRTVKTSTAIPPICTSTAIRQKKVDKGRKEAESKPVSKEDEDRERLLRLREAGWRLDGNGKWFKDESVEFDSDEEVPEELA